MTGKEAIIHYLGTHNSFCAPDVAALTGATVTSINQAAAKMARAGLLVIEGKVWRTVYYRFATREEREGKMSTNLIFKECRQSAAMKRVLAVSPITRFLLLPPNFWRSCTVLKLRTFKITTPEMLSALLKESIFSKWLAMP